MKFALLHRLQDLEINVVILIHLLSIDEKSQTHDSEYLFVAQTAA